MRDNQNQDEHATLQEAYVSNAASSSNLRIDGPGRTPGDIILAAGMNRRRLGLALLRLMSEWDRRLREAQLRIPTEEQVERMAALYRVEDALLPNGERNPNAGRVRLRGEEGEQFLLPLDLARETAAQWYEDRLQELMPNLKTLPDVRDALTHFLAQRDVEEPVHVVSKVLLWWLSPVCTVCRGVGERVVAGTNRLSGRTCSHCRGTGKLKVPHGLRGRMVVSHIEDSCAEAHNQLKAVMASPKRQKRAKAQDLPVAIGQRWRCRGGGLWDIFEKVSEESGTVYIGRAAGNPIAVWRWRQNGRPWAGPDSGWGGMDLIEYVCQSPGHEDGQRPVVAETTG